MKIYTFLLAAGLSFSAHVATANDWSGFYGGLQIGGSDIDTSIGAPGDGTSIGAFAGYNVQNGPLVYGAELDFDSTDYDIGPGAVMIDTTARLKGRIGTEVGKGLLYGTAGVVRASTDVLGNDTGYFYGAGYELQLGNGATAGLEVLQHEFDDFNSSGIGVDVLTYKVRIGFKF